MPEGFYIVRGLKEPLTAEIRHLTRRLDAIIREQAGGQVFRRLEQIRDCCVTGRQSRHRADSRFGRALIERLGVAEAYQVAHAMSLFFQLVNLCEERERIRRLESKEAPRMSLRHTFRELKAAGVPPRQLQRCLDALEIQPVLTAHPTEAKRRAVLNQLWRVDRDLDHPDEALEALWQTEEIRERGVGPLQEVESTLYYFDRAIFETVANFYTTFDAELAAHFPSVRRRRYFLNFASWVGGDRDGNPFVTPQLSRTTAQWHKCLAMDFYDRECGMLVQEITHATEQPGGRVRKATVKEAPPFQPYEVLRSRLSALRGKLHAGKGTMPEILGTLRAVRQGLLRQKAARAANGRIQRLLTQANVFGLHLAELDFRDHSGKLDRAEMELREEFRAMLQIQREHGRQAAHHFVLSMTRSEEDLLGLFRLARKEGLKDVDFVPLFETIHDLENAATILARCWEDPGYRAHVRRRGNLQEIMVGYSDSNKDGGYLSANWFLYRAQKQMARLADDAGIKLRFFHGKGGTIDRGGGASYHTLRAQPHAAHGGRIRITEQGEIISLKYSNPAIAQRNLEQLTSAVIAGQCLAGPERPELREWEAHMESLANVAFGFYRRLVYETPEFSPYFWQATPIDLIEHLRLGSRPSRRAQTTDIRELRAIPWVFAWTQSRHLLSAWYGVGYALEEFIKTHAGGLEHLRQMYGRWPFFLALVDNAEVSLAKTRLDIARQYAALVEPAVVRRKIFGLIEAEYRRSVRMILAVTQNRRLLENHPTLARSIRLRNPYVDPLSFLQIRFLRLWRGLSESQRTERTRRLLALTVKGIAFGMKSTG